jgi:hypothetical protein
MEKYQKITRQHTRLVKNMSRSTRRACIKGFQMMKKSAEKKGLETLIELYDNMIQKYKF